MTCCIKPAVTDYPTKMAKAFIEAFGENHDLKTSVGEHEIWIGYMEKALAAVDPGLLDGTAIVVPADRVNCHE